MSSPDQALAARMGRFALPERSDQLGASLLETERAFDIFDAADRPLNLTYADTHAFPAPAWAPDEVRAAAAGDFESYTPFRGNESVRAALGPSLSELLGVPVDPETELALTPGTQAGLFTVLAALVDGTSTVAMPDPEYLANERLLRFLGADVAHVPILWEGGGPVLDLERLRAAGREAGFLLFSHPNNPTGSVYDPDHVAEIARIAVEEDLLVIVDQLYCRLVYDGRPFAHLIAQPGMRERCVTLVGPSKTEQMSGYRVGALVGPPWVVDAVEDVLGITAIRAPAYTQPLLARWIRDDTDFLAERVAAYERLRDLTLAELARIEALEVWPSGGTSYLFPRFRQAPGSDLDVARTLLREAGVIINPGFQFGPRGVGAFRICFAQDPEIWPERLARMVDVLEGMVESVEVSS